MLSVYIDFKSPAAYLALGPTLALAERTGAAIRWRPFQTAPYTLPEKVSDETVGQSHRRVRAESRRATHIKYAAHQGIPLTFRKASGKTDLALGALTLLTSDPLPYIKAAFAAYWHEQANLDDPETLNALLSRLGHNPAETPPDTCREALAAAQSTAEDLGIVDAPAYIIKDQMFIGREHLPWITELIEAGR